MTTRSIQITLFLAFFSVVPVMGMNNPTFKEAQDAIGDTIKKKYQKQYGISIDQQPLLRINNKYDIQKIAENNIDQGILLEQHLDDLLSIDPTQDNESIKTILDNNFDKQQKLMGLIECASFTGELDTLTYLINYGLENKLIPHYFLDGIDETVDSFDTIATIYKNFLYQLGLSSKVKIEPKYTLDHTFNPTINDIKSVKYNNDAKYLTKINDLTAFEIPNQPNFIIISDNNKIQQRDQTTHTIQNIFHTTSLPNKITFVLKLSEIQQKISNNISQVENAQNIAGRYDLFLDNIASNALGLCLLIFLSIYEEKTMYENLNTILTSRLKRIIEHPCINQNIKEKATKEFLKAKDAVDFTLTKIYTKSLYTLFFNKVLKLFGIAAMTYGFIEAQRNNINTLLAFERSILFGSLCGLTPLPQIYFLLKYLFTTFPHAKELQEMKQEQKNVQKLIEEFKESIKKDYKL